ncbi:glucokinase [Pseudodesulfovibrio tunisiensis]|uniref:glucokinase n=1 Tax=Pseudodesulfovibrio tunisiensis TaxID=463192 RepID=UPI001FB47014|nr:glucokinase [Pseudodesulfovibrio tunisiensis]
MPKILAADIGGTNSRFAIFETDGNGRLDIAESLWLKTHEAESFDQLLGQLRDNGFPICPGEYDSAALAVAGAVWHGVLCRKPPNMPFSIDLRETDLGVERACLVNDFCAQAYACRTSAVDEAVVLQDGEHDDLGVIGVIGAGTGLGYSGLIRGETRWTALASEGGHMAFPFVGKEEAEYAEFNRRESGRCWPEGDTVVTGLGLQLVHRFLTGENLEPQEVAARLAPDCETTKWFARFYGRACRDWAIGLMAHGGMYIAGGVAARNPILVQSPEFLKEFHNTHVYGDFLRSVPVKLNANEESGLFGAAFYGMQLLG